MKLPVQSHQQSVRVPCHLKPLQLRHTGCSRLKSRSKWGSILDHDGQIQVFGSVLDRRLHIWTVTHVSIKVTPLPPQYMNISWNVFSAMKMIFHHNLSKEPKFALLRTIPAGSEGSAQTLTTYQETRPISTILYKTPNFLFSLRDAKHHIIQRSGPRQWQSQQYRQKYDQNVEVKF